MAHNFISAVQTARAAVQAAGVAMTERAKAVIEERREQLKDAVAQMDDIVQRNVALGREDNETTRLVQAMVRRVSAAEVALEGMNNAPDSPDAADAFMEAVTEALPPLAAAQAAVMARQRQLLDQAAVMLEEVTKGGEELRREHEADGSPEDEASLAVREAVDAVAAARAAHAEFLANTEDTKCLGTFLLSVNPAKTAVLAAKSKLADRLNAAARQAAERAAEIVAVVLPELLERQNVKGASRDDAACRAVAHVRELASTVAKQQEALDKMDQRGSSEWKKAARALSQAVPGVETAVATAKQALDTRDVAVLAGAGTELAALMESFKKVEARNQFADVGDDRYAPAFLVGITPLHSPLLLYVLFGQCCVTGAIVTAHDGSMCRSATSSAGQTNRLH